MGSSSSTNRTTSGRTRNGAVGRNTFIERHPGFGVYYRNGVRNRVPLSPSTNDELDAPKKEVIKVEKVDFLVAKNATSHHTDEYDIVQGTEKVPQLVVRRGQPFNISVTFNRPYDKAKDELKLMHTIGAYPIVAKGTEVAIILSDKDEPGKWGAKIESQSGNTVNLTMFTPPTCFVGRWKFSIQALKKSDKETEIVTYKHKERIYILFNPWCKDDPVYFPNKTESGPDNEALDEYVLNDSGKIYAGNYAQMSVKPWNFGQFEGNVLDCVLWLLEKDMPISGRGNPIFVSRKLSATINSPDDSGVLVGNWSGDYSGGTSPTEWGGSVAIFEAFHKTKEPVQYGQCWVFSGLLTTALRTLGIPARSVTNFASAHDSDGSITIDVHFSPKGDTLDDYNVDSVWNFHVWNEAYMTRPELPKGCGGWQAVDATPQETSDGYYCCGPVSVAAIKNGDVVYPYDGPFVFAEINADKLFWIVDEFGGVTRATAFEKKIGKKISSKKPGRKMSGVMYVTPWRDDPDRDDLTGKYKHPEGSDAERAAVLRANQTGSTNKAAYERGEEDVKFELVELDQSMYGNAFDITLKLKNTSKEKRTIAGKLSVSSVFYTGLHADMVKHIEVNETLDGGKDKEVKMSVPFKEYDEKIVQHCMMKLSTLCSVKETKQVFTDQDDFRLVKPDLTIKAPSEVEVGKKFKAEISFTNPLPIPLTNCVLVVEGAGLQEPLTQKQPSVAAKGTFMANVELSPRKAGERIVNATFNSKELEGITGVCAVKVKK